MEAEYNIKLTFSGKLTDEQKEQISKTILDTLVYQVNTGGLVPDDAEEFTTSIMVERLK